MASPRSTLTLLCVCSLLLMLLSAHATAAADPQSGTTASDGGFYLRGSTVAVFGEERAVATQESLEFIERRELYLDYMNPKANCKKNC